MMRSTSPSCRGFTLVEVAIVLLIIGLLVGGLIPMAGAFRDQQQRKESTVRMSAVEQALLNYVMVNRRLPCPADGTLPSGAANAGIEQRTSGDCTAMNQGVVPWVTLGLGENDATDAWGNRFTYRVPTAQTGFSREQSMDASKCDPAGTTTAPFVSVAGQSIQTCAACTGSAVTNCTSPLNFLNARGLAVQDESGTSINNPSNGTGAAYLLVSHGSDGAGAYNSSGNLIAGTALGVNEGWNANNNGIRLPPLAYFHGSQLNESAGALHFDDLVSHPSILTLLTKAQLAPRVQP